MKNLKIIKMLKEQVRMLVRVTSKKTTLMKGSPILMISKAHFKTKVKCEAGKHRVKSAFNKTKIRKILLS